MFWFYMSEWGVRENHGVVRSSKFRLLLCFFLSAIFHMLLVLDASRVVAKRGGATGFNLCKNIKPLLIVHLAQQATSQRLSVTERMPESKSPLVAQAMETLPAFISPGGLAQESSELGFYLPDLSYYYPATELTRKPALLSDVSADFASLPDGGLVGRVVLRLLIDESGSVAEVLVESSSATEAFRDSVVGIFSKVAFVPGVKEEVAVKSQMLIEVGYEGALGLNVSSIQK